MKMSDGGGRDQKTERNLNTVKSALPQRLHLVRTLFSIIEQRICTFQRAISVPRRKISDEKSVKRAAPTPRLKKFVLAPAQIKPIGPLYLNPSHYGISMRKAREYRVTWPVVVASAEQKWQREVTASRGS
jgi:hypothetical protein